MRKSASFLVGLLAAMSFSLQATAASCYTPRQFEAEQGLRIHSELMVIALTCMKMPRGGQSMYSKYQAFTQKNQSLIAGYESDLIGYYRAQGARKPEEQFHSLRTGLANDISQHAISMSVSSFCQQFGSRIDQALAMDQTKLRKWAQQVWPKSPTIHPQCRRG